jgi:DUF1707 SHOCT-like domain
MAYDPNIRASDADRDRAASLLREHYAAGRLNPEEFADRLEQALRAKTVGEIDALLSDLPGIDLYRLPDAALTRQPRQAQNRRRRRHDSAWRAAWGVWFTVTLVCFVVWALAGFGYPWPLWVAGPWGAVLGGIWVTSHGLGGGPGRGAIGGAPEHGQLPHGDDDLPGRLGR